MAQIGRVLAPAVIGLAFAAATGTGALAQSGEMRELLRQLERVQRELTTLQQHVYQGRPPPASGAANPLLGAGETQVAARLEIRLTQLENELRDMTGRIEEAQHAIRQIDKRIEKLVADVDYRLAALEKQRVSGPAASAEAEEGAPTAPEPGSAESAAAAPPETGGPPRAIPPRSLGQVPRSAVTGSKSEVKTAAAPDEPPETEGEPPPEQQYARAIDLMQGQKFSEAERAFREFIDANPDHELRDNAHYWLGESYYVRKDYQRAAYAFADGFQKFPEGGKAPDNLLKLGMSLGRLGKSNEACTAFSRLLENFPNANGTLKSRVSREQRTYGCN